MSAKVRTTHEELVRQARETVGALFMQRDASDADRREWLETIKSEIEIYLAEIPHSQADEEAI